MAEIVFTFSCPGCCGSGGFQYQCRSREGTATLCGYPEYTTPSTPPKKYRQKTFGGSLFAEIISTCDGGGTILRTHQSAFSGVNTYNAATCVATKGSVSTGTAAGHSGFDDINVFSFADNYVTIDGGHGVETYTRTSKSVVYTPGTGCPQVCGTCCASRQTSCDAATETLAQEDTEEAAMARAEADWSEWGAGGCCTSKQPRGAGVFTFGFTEAEYRIRVKGEPGQLINLLLTFTRTDGDPYEEIRQFVAAGPEYTDDWQVFSIVASAGHGTCLASVRLYTP